VEGTIKNWSDRRLAGNLAHIIDNGVELAIEFLASSAADISSDAVTSLRCTNPAKPNAS
jgi:hypothetical protein